MVIGLSRGRKLRIRVFVFGFLAAILMLASRPATAQQWNEFYYHSGTNTRFYYDTSSVSRTGSTVLVRWTDSNLQGGVERLVYLAQVECGARTIRSLQVDRFDAQSGAYIGTVDLRASDSPRSADPGTMAGYLLGRVC